MPKQTAISARDLSIGYPRSGKKEANILYRRLHLDLYPGEITCLLGTNGSGKSTLLRTLSGLQPPLEGDLLLFGKDPATYNEREISKLLGLVLTDRIQAGGLTVKELVGLGRYPYTGFFGKSKDEDREIIKKAMAAVFIEGKADSYVAELSDGERQKAMIAKALAQECPVILLDEPTAFLDVMSRIDILSLLRQLAVDHNKAILLSTHDIEQALLLADKLWILSKEQGLLAGVTEDLVLTDKIASVFSGKQVTFNKNTGNFNLIPGTGKKVYLKASETLFHWTLNLLTKNGFMLTDRKEEARFTLNIISENQLEMQQIGSPILTFSSFEELYYQLKIIDK